MKWYLQALKHYAVFEGRAPRREYWIFVLCQILMVLAISAVERALAIANPEILFGWYTAGFLLLTLLPALAVSIRRLHDTGRSGWWGLLHAVPVIGTLLLQPFMLAAGASGRNRYGTAPKLKTA
ncbi:Inner membrane protein YhaI [compost metagenome]